METFTLPFMLCSILTLVSGSPILPVNITTAGLCQFIRNHQDNHLIGEYIPQCDIYGNFKPQQCWGSTGECWCVNILTGQEVPHTRTGPGQTPVSCDNEYYCPDGWTYFRGRCFIFINEAKTWVEAETYCLFEGSNLASIHSYEENHLIQGLTKGEGHSFPHTWIGGYNCFYQTIWLWSDGSRFNYGLWYDDIAIMLNSNCLMMNYGYAYKWDPYPCNQTLPFVCAKTSG